MQFVNDIGMFVINRGPSSCKWRSEFCTKNCYNLKLYRVYGHVMRPADIKNEIFWNELTGDLLNNLLKRKRKFNKRIRLCSRGEAFTNIKDVEKIKDLLEKNKNILFWIPTRAWNSILYDNINELRNIENSRILASIDPSNTKSEIYKLAEEGWSTMFFGDNKLTENRFMCPKTWRKEKGACAYCNEGCFSEERVDVHLKKH